MRIRFVNGPAAGMEQEVQEGIQQVDVFLGVGYDEMKDVASRPKVTYHRYGTEWNAYPKPNVALFAVAEVSPGPYRQPDPELKLTADDERLLRGMKIKV